MMSSMTEQGLSGRRRAIARLITHLENKHPNAQHILDNLYPHTGGAHLVGITGSPGTGKSSLVNKLAKLYRSQNKTVAIIAVDPTSPFSGGAILGDRIRMRELAGDPGIFIRSMASRGSLGGLARAVADDIKVLAAAGFELILIEPGGSGQREADVAKTAQQVIVVEAPGLGDDVQDITAGILEIDAIFVVNKADRPGAEKTVATLRAMLELGHASTHHMLHHGQLMAVEGVSPNGENSPEHAWQIPVLKTTAIKGEGIEPVVAAIDRHFNHLQESGELTNRNRTRLIDELETMLQTELMARLLHQLPPNYLPAIVAQLVDRNLSPFAAVQEILTGFSGVGSRE